MPAPEPQGPDLEKQQLSYQGHELPWFVHLMWVSFWAFAIYYVLRYLLPALQTEWLNPP
jgi:hypothetical protein